MEETTGKHGVEKEEEQTEQAVEKGERGGVQNGRNTGAH